MEKIIFYRRENIQVLIGKAARRLKKPFLVSLITQVESGSTLPHLQIQQYYRPSHTKIFAFVHV